MPRSNATAGTPPPRSSSPPPPVFKTRKEAQVEEMVLSEGLETSAWFPFFILAFGSLLFFFAGVAWSYPHVKAGEYLFVPVLLASVGGMVLSPVIGHVLSNWVLAATDSVGRCLLHPIPLLHKEDKGDGEDEDDRGSARGLVGVLLVLMGVVGWLVWEVRSLKAATGRLRAEVAYLALREVALDRSGKVA